MTQVEMGKVAVEYQQQQRKQKVCTCLILSGWFATLFLTDILFGYPLMKRLDGILALAYLACAPLTAMLFPSRKRSFPGVLAIANLILISSFPLFFTRLGIPVEVLLLRQVMTLLFSTLIGPYFIQPKGFAFFLILLYNAACFYYPILRLRELDLMMGYIVVTYSFTLLFSYFFLDILRMNVTHVSSLLSAKKNAEDMALRDELTGVYNRRYCDNLLRILIENETEKTLLFIDLDDYQNICQAHGHLVGDSFLKKSASAIGECIRSGDVAARFGGNQFVVVLDSGDIPLALSISKRIRKALGEIIPEFTSVSIGVTKIIAGITQQAVLVNADTALFRAKSGGIEQIAVVDPANPRMESEHWPDTDADRRGQ
ncbi:MAG: diguanylate cyclase [Thermovirgaceae bacterium]|nr:diguanylate cyclase [Thermovirgaceae bacterium]